MILVMLLALNCEDSEANLTMKCHPGLAQEKL